MKLYSYNFAHDNLPHELFSAFCDTPYSLLFDSADTSHSLGHFSYILFQPIETIETVGNRTTVTNLKKQSVFESDPFEVIKNRIDEFELKIEKNYHNAKDLPPFNGGAAGYFGYELMRTIENIPSNNQERSDTPDLAIGIYDQVYAYDHSSQKGYYLAYAENEPDARHRFEHFQSIIEKQTRNATLPIEDSQWVASHTKTKYLEDVQKVIDYIHAGDIFQANISQKFTAALPKGFDSWEHYKVLRKLNSAPFSNYMNFGVITIASTSPERFIASQNREVDTRPIKGTAPRQEDDSIDQLYRNQLENSDKDRAENTMIVDLLRNDLSKVCEDHSIVVTQLCGIESFSKVHHLVSIVKGILKADKSPLDLLKACFPGGSITGAPKVRAMEIIEEIEASARGPYCGAMGYIGFDGCMDTNIAIRTLVYEKENVSFNVGGGIVDDSKPEAEYNETLLKAEAMFASFEVYSEAVAEEQEQALA